MNGNDYNGRWMIQTMTIVTRLIKIQELRDATLTIVISYFSKENLGNRNPMENHLFAELISHYFWSLDFNFQSKFSFILF